MAEHGEAIRDEHLELLARTRVVRRAAVDGDIDEVHSELCQLRNVLVRHLRGEREDAHPADLHARVTRHGQDRLLAFVERMLADSDDEDGRCTCLVRTAELRALLIRQIRLEGGLRPPDRGQPPSTSRNRTANASGCPPHPDSGPANPP